MIRELVIYCLSPRSLDLSLSHSIRVVIGGAVIKEGRVVQRFRGGLVFKAHRLLHHSTLGLRVIKKKKKVVIGPRQIRGPTSAWRLREIAEFYDSKRPCVNLHVGPFDEKSHRPYGRKFPGTFIFLPFSSLELSDSEVYNPYTRALLGTASHF